MDGSLSYVLIMYNLKTIYAVLFIIYALSSINEHPKMITLIQIMAFSTALSVVELISSCIVCGSLHDTSHRIYAALDAFDANKLSEFEFKEWLMFKNVSRKTEFGFTIGGFASLKKTTLIAVCIWMSKFLNILTHLAIQIFTFILNYTVILLQTTQHNTKEYQGHINFVFKFHLNDPKQNDGAEH